MVTEFRASGRRAEILRNAARFTFREAIRALSFRHVGYRFGKRIGNRQSLLRAGSHRPATQHQPRRHALRCAVGEPAGSVTIVGGLAHPTHLGHTQPVRVQPAGDGHQPRHRPGHHAVRAAERLQRQQFAVGDRGDHRRRRPRARRSPISPATPAAGPTSASARGRPSRSSSTWSAAASMCRRASACNGARCHTPTRGPRRLPAPGRRAARRRTPDR